MASVDYIAFGARQPYRLATLVAIPGAPTDELHMLAEEEANRTGKPIAELVCPNSPFLPPAEPGAGWDRYRSICCCSPPSPRRTGT